MTKNLFLLLFMLLVVGCRDREPEVPSSSPGPAHDLEETSWRLDHMLANGEQLPMLDTNQRISFGRVDGGTAEFSGHDGCNEIWGEFTVGVDSQELNLGEMGQTLRECPVEAVEVIVPGETPVFLSAGHQAFREALLAVVGYEIRNGMLRLQYPADRTNALVFRPE